MCIFRRYYRTHFSITDARAHGAEKKTKREPCRLVMCVCRFQNKARASRCTNLTPCLRHPCRRRCSPVTRWLVGKKTNLSGLIVQLLQGKANAIHTHTDRIMIAGLASNTHTHTHARIEISVRAFEPSTRVSRIVLPLCCSILLIIFSNIYICDQCYLCA